MELRVQRVLAWSGVAMIFFWFGSFVLIAGYIPPSDPSASADSIVQLYANNSVGIRIGMVVSMFGSALLVPWAIAISGQLKRIDGANALADTQMVSCALLSLEFIVPIGVWMAAAFRFEEQLPEITLALHDLGWILFVTVIWSLIIQLVAIAAAIFIDRGPERVFPRWLGFLNLWAAILILPAGMVLFFKNGPFAWNGIVGFFVPLVALLIWMLCMTWAMHSNLSRQILAENS